MRNPIRNFIAIAGLGFLLSGCQLFTARGQIKSGSLTVSGVNDAGKPATLASDTTTASITLPAGTKVTTTKLEASAAIPAIGSQPAIPAKPTKEITTFTVPSPAKWETINTRLSANTGTVDTSVAEHKVDVAESRPLLYAALASLVAAGFFVYRAYPTPALICGAAAVVFFLAWKASGLPDWFWAVGAVGIAAAVFLFIGHERGLSTPTPAPTK